MCGLQKLSLRIPNFACRAAVTQPPGIHARAFRNRCRVQLNRHPIKPLPQTRTFACSYGASEEVPTAVELASKNIIFELFRQRTIHQSSQFSSKCLQGKRNCVCALMVTHILVWGGGLPPAVTLVALCSLLAIKYSF